MAQRIQLKAERRTRTGTLAVKKSRRAGRIPAVLYGRGEPQALELSGVELVRALNAAHSSNVLVDLEIAGEAGARKHLALIKEIQQHPLKDKVLHVDLNEIDPNQKIHAEVNVVEIGECIGVKNGGILDHLIRHLRVECLPQHLPSEIRIDVTSLDIGGAVHVGEIAAPEGVVFTNDASLPVFMVHAPKVEAEPAPGAAAAAPVQPEVIKQKKEEPAEAAKKEK
ncbi:MAG: 50S ribosomal protein L25 [Candidatus Methylacidiphilales bacterium]|nr:50S ribosomal protein L25 [Candidatus Methylacidiphilales bacterium]